MPAAAEMVEVRIEAPEPVDLEVRGLNDWEKVCTSPCNKALSTKEQYRINGSGLRASTPFRIAPGSAQKIEVEPHSSTAMGAAIVVVVIGSLGLVPVLAVTVAFGVVMLASVILICPLVQLAPKETYGGCLGDIASDVGQYYGKPYVWIPAVAGLGMAGIGGIVLASTPKSGVRMSPLGTAPPAPQPATWRLPELPDRNAELPKMSGVVFPLVSGTF